MASLLFLSVLVLVIVFNVLMPLWKSNQKKLFWIDTVFTVAAFALNAIAGFDIYLPSLIKPIIDLYHMIFG